MLDYTGEVVLLEPAYVALLSGKTSDVYLMAVLNSNLLTAYLRKETTTLSGNFLELQVKYVERLPIRRIHFTTPEAERACHTANLITHYQSMATGITVPPIAWKGHPLLAEVAALLPKTAAGEFVAFQPGATGAEEQSDVVHDLLAYLAEQMIAMHKEKQERVAAFWETVAAATNPPTLTALRDKGKQERSRANDPACQPYVDAESGSSRTLDESLGWDEEAFRAFVTLLAGSVALTPGLEAAYRAHHAPYKALVARIAATDALIDQVVYRLYGLTEEEIEVVEGRR